MPYRVRKKNLKNGNFTRGNNLHEFNTDDNVDTYFYQKINKEPKNVSNAHKIN